PMKTNLPVSNKNVDYPANKQLISTTDLDSYITYVNDDFMEVSGYDWDELIGSPHNVVRHPDTPPALFKDLWETIRNGDVWNAVLKNRCKNGDHYWVNAYVTPVFSGSEIVGYQSVRTKPTAEQVREAEQLYRTLNQDRSKEVPKKRRLRDVSLGTWLAVVVAILVLLSAAKMWDATTSHLKLTSAIQEAEAIYAASEQSGAGAQSQIDEIRAITSSGYYGTVLLAGINIVALIVIYFLLRRYVFCPLIAIRGVLKRMAGGQLRQDIRVASKNEVGELHQSAKLLQARLNTVFGHFSESAGALTKAAEQLNNTGQRTAGGMKTQQNEVEQVATAMNEMASTVDEVARNAAQTAQAVQDAENQAQTGKTQVAQTHEAVAQLSARFDRTAESIETLQEHGDKIDTIIQVIGGIAEQTNLLALNAAIEAARAGEHGRGFAVVAEEVRSLARKTQDSTQEIREMIENLRAGIHDSVGNVQAGRERMEAVEEQASQTDRALESISQAIATITDMSSQIATATEEQSAVAEEMSRNITSIAAQTEHTTDDSREVVESGQKLSSMSAKLVELLNQFNKR
ncbi:MAG: PAS domain-containing methyl-accepting chemotaxis protein, partial [Halomonas sp.]|nr:PAS domain-containing methyl-accepting chemotaxis protein [Halomonas sp.]